MDNTSNYRPTVVSLFSGAGGMDLGLATAGFNVIWANDNDKHTWATYRKNFPDTRLVTNSIRNIPSDEIPQCDGVVGGAPCQSWSVAGAKRGMDDSRGQLFYELIRVVRDKQPKFFIAENVSGMVAPRNAEILEILKGHLRGCGYTLSFALLNAKDYGVPQDRKRVFFIGFRRDLKLKFMFPEKIDSYKTLRDAIGDLPQPGTGAVKNHTFMEGSFSSMYMSRNRVRGWEEPSFTIQAGGRHAPLHPSAPKMVRVTSDRYIFAPGHESEYRRLTVRECARIQTFPDSHIFRYADVGVGYKLVGNAVPCELAEYLASAILDQLHNED